MEGQRVAKVHACVGMWVHMHAGEEAYCECAHSPQKDKHGGTEGRKSACVWLWLCGCICTRGKRPILNAHTDPQRTNTEGQRVAKVHVCVGMWVHMHSGEEAHCECAHSPQKDKHGGTEGRKSACVWLWLCGCICTRGKRPILNAHTDPQRTNTEGQRVAKVHVCVGMWVHMHSGEEAHCECAHSPQKDIHGGKVAAKQSPMRCRPGLPAPRLGMFAAVCVDGCTYSVWM